MKEVCIPISDLKENDLAEVEVRIPKRKLIWKYRIEPFEIAFREEAGTEELQIEKLRKKIKSYDSNWELIQIFDSDKSSGYIQLLYRSKK